MADTATVADSTPLPDPTAIEPVRVMVLTEVEQHLLLDVLDGAQYGHGPAINASRISALRGRVAYSDEYVNPEDQLTRVTLAKRRLEAEIKRYNRAIEACEEQVVDDWLANARSGSKHAATGATLRLDQKVWAKLEVDDEDLSADDATALKAQVKGDVGEILERIPDLAGMVRPDFNLNTLSAYFREQVRTYNAEQQALPEDERVPRPVESFLPEALQGLLRLEDKPRIQVRA